MPEHPIPKRNDGVFLHDVFEHADPVVAEFMAKHNALLERVTVLERAIETHLEAISADMCCEVCEPGGLGEHRKDCSVPALQDVLDA